MSKQTLHYIKSIEEDKLLYDAFIISLLGIVGLYNINLSNTKIIRNLKKYKQYLNKINDDGLDLFILIQKMYDKKLINYNTTIEIMTYFRNFRDPSFSFDLNEDEFKELLKKIPSTILRNTSSDVRIIFKAYINNIIPIERGVIKLFSYASRKRMNIDFMLLAREMRKE